MRLIQIWLTLFDSEEAFHAICNITLFLIQVMACVHLISLSLSQLRNTWVVNGWDLSEKNQLFAICVPCLLGFSWHTWNVLFSNNLPLLPLEEKNLVCYWWPMHLQQIDTVGGKRQWSATYSEQKFFNCGTRGAVSFISSSCSSHLNKVLFRFYTGSDCLCNYIPLHS